MVQSAQPPFERRDWPQIIGCRAAEHCKKTSKIDRDRGELREIAATPSDDNKRRGAAKRHRYSEEMNDRIGEGLAMIVVPTEFRPHALDILVHCGEDRAENESGLLRKDY
jgi:hypothetical protein